MTKIGALVEAIPYIKEFNGQVFVIKLGGSMLVNEKTRLTILEDIALLKFVGVKPILVHGGGKDISKLSEQLGLKVRFVEGLRHTDDETLKVVSMVLGRVNSEVVEELENLDCKAIGTTGKSGKMVRAKRMEKWGNVGRIEKVDESVLEGFLEQGYTPVVQPIGLDEKGHAVNINADELASAISKALKARKLIYLTNVPGLLENEKDEKSLISSITTKELKQKLKWDEIKGGMIPKTKGMIDAIEAGVKNVHIIDGREQHSILREVFTDTGIGTIVRE